jgi:hypothetical protein
MWSLFTKFNCYECRWAEISVSVFHSNFCRRNPPLMYNRRLPLYIKWINFPLYILCLSSWRMLLLLPPIPRNIGSIYINKIGNKSINRKYWYSCWIFDIHCVFFYLRTTFRRLDSVYTFRLKPTRLVPIGWTNLGHQKLHKIYIYIYINIKYQRELRQTLQNSTYMRPSSYGNA